MPETARVLDEFRAVFGTLPYGKVVENGRTVEWGGRREIEVPRIPGTLMLQVQSA